MNQVCCSKMHYKPNCFREWMMTQWAAVYRCVKGPRLSHRGAKAQHENHVDLICGCFVSSCLHLQMFLHHVEFLCGYLLSHFNLHFSHDINLVSFCGHFASLSWFFLFHPASLLLLCV